MKSDYTSSIKFDKRLYKQDIQGSIAHVNMLSKQSIIKEKEASQIVNGLMEIKIEIESGDFPWKDELEDIHMNIENRLFIKIGDVAGKLHTARSRNDQIALDLRMYVKDVIKDVFSALKLLRNSFIKISELNSDFFEDVYITHIPGSSLNDLIDTAKEVSVYGLNPVPHIPARSITDENTLNETCLKIFTEKFSFLKIK